MNTPPLYRPTLRKLLMMWLAVYPVITCLALVLEPFIDDWATPIRTLAVSSIMVPVTVLWTVPALDRLLGLGGFIPIAVSRRDARAREVAQD